MATKHQQANWHPDVYALKKQNLKIRQQVLRVMRDFFVEHDFAEVDTPILQVSPGNEVHLQNFATELKDPMGKSVTRFLQTSPEFAMKKLLVAGVPRLYQLAHVFRNKENSSRHHPEFLMLEWYRADCPLTRIMDDCCDLIRHVASAIGIEHFVRTGRDPCYLFGDWERLTVAEAFQRYVGIDLLATAPDVRRPDVHLLATQARSRSVRVLEDDSWDDLFFRIMGEQIEPYLGGSCPTILYDYPVSQAVLARAKPDDPRVAERFELYIAGLELANAFGELTDADEQERRFEADMSAREQIYGDRTPVDADFLEALRHGMPDSSGIALGVDRLVMLATGADHIEDVLWLPVR